MHCVQAKGILIEGSMNPYRGCSHGCIYCDSRSRCYNMDHLFEDIEVKINAPELLDAALRGKRRPIMIGTGSMSDPYCEAEERYHITRRCMELAYKHGCGFSLLTKSAKVLEDLELLCAINRRCKAVVQMTLTTYDDELCRIVEPNVSVTSERFRALCALRDAGIPTVVWLTPLLPFINDSTENLEGLMSYCDRVKVYGIISFGCGLTLREGNREYFYAQLDRHFPGLKLRYMERYGNAYELPSPNEESLCRLFSSECDRLNIKRDIPELFRYLRNPNKTEQLQLF